MAYSESLARRVRDLVVRQRGITEKKMFGGVAFLLDGNMLIGVWKSSLIVRLGSAQADLALTEPFVVEFDITGKPMRGWVMVEPDGLETDQQLGEWIQCADAFVSALPKK
jgi:hypothetical protein